MNRLLRPSWALLACTIFFMPAFAFGFGTGDEATSTHLTPEYWRGGHWFTGDSRTVACEGETIVLSVLPNNLIPRWNGPNVHNVLTQNLNLGSVDASDSGVYTATYQYPGGYTIQTKISVDVVTEPTLRFDVTDATCGSDDGAIKLDIDNLDRGVFFELHDGARTSLPTSWPVSQRDQSGISQSGFDIWVAERNDNYSLRFSATLDVPTTGWYEFFTTSDDGSKLFIDDHLVVNNDGVHAMRERSGWKHLTKGLHQIVVTYFERTGGQGLHVQWDGPGFGKQWIPKSRLYVPYTIHWNTNASTQHISNLSAGRYTADVRYAGDNCSVWDDVQVRSQGGSITDGGQITSPHQYLCLAPGQSTTGASMFQATAGTCSGGSTPSYQWQVKSRTGGSFQNIAGATSQNFNPGNVSAGSSWYRRVASCECDDASLTTNVRDIHVFPTPDAEVTFVNARCDHPLGSITFTYEDNNPGQFDDWQLSIDGGKSFTRVSANGGSFTFSNLIAGTYLPVIRSERGNCDTEFPAITIDDLEEPNASFNVSDNVICSGSSRTFVALDQKPGAVYTWDFSEFADQQFVTGPGPHEITFTLPDDQDRNTTIFVVLTETIGDCFDRDTDPFEIIDLADAEVTTVNPTCGDPNGTITFTFINHPNRSHIRFSIDGGASFVTVRDDSESFTFTDISAGDYDLVTRWGNNQCGNNDLEEVTLIDQAAPEVDATASASPIAIGDKVTLTATATGGTAPFVYQWDNGAGAGASVMVMPMVTTTYTVTVTDENGCEDTAPITVEVLPLPTAMTAAVDPVCTEPNGSITFTFEDVDGRDEISLSIDGGMTFTTVADNSGSFTFTGLAAGDYDAAVQWVDGLGGLVDLGTITLTDQAGPAATVTADMASVCEGTSAVLTATPVGGTAPFTYEWSTGETTEMITVSPSLSTTYNVTITDGNGCMDVDEVMVVVNPVPSVEIVCVEDQVTAYTALNTPNCPGGPDAGFFLVMPSTNGARALYDIEGGVFTENLGDGTATFSARVTNFTNPGQAFDVSVTFFGRTVVPIEGSPKEDEDCIGDIDNTDWYYYTSFEGTLAGVDDAQGAVISISRVGEPFQVGTGANMKIETELGAGGWFQYTIDRQPNDSSLRFTRSPRGGDINVRLEDPTQDRSCLEICSGESTTLEAEVTGGVGGFEFLWSNGETTPSITVSPMTTTTYTVEITDANGCTAESSAIVDVNEDPTASVMANDATCEEANGSATASAASGSNITYNWSTGATTATVNDLTAGGYIVTVTSDDRCEDILATTVETTLKPTAEIVCLEDELTSYDALNTPNCPGGPDAGFFLVMNSTLDTRALYAIEDGVFTENEAAGTATFTGTVVNFTNAAQAFTVEVTFTGRTDVPTEGSPKEDEDCIGDVDNSDWHYYMAFTGTLTGIDAAAGSVIEVERLGEPFQVGTGANLKIETEFGGGGWFDYTILQQPTDPAVVFTKNNRGGDFNFFLTNETTFTPDCFNIVPGDSRTISVNATPAENVFTYLWSTGETTESITVAPMVTTDYSVTVTNEDGCETELEVTVNVISSSVARGIVQEELGSFVNNNESFIEANQTAPVTTTSEALVRRSIQIDLKSPEFQLEQNAPNPFNGITSIRFVAPASGTATLMVRDLTGRIVGQVQQDVVDGKNRFEFDAGRLPSGTYLYTVELNGDHATKRMVVVK